jgi:NAD(P)-dependent dehydrogenase (short-subunit alcohol dehydrogenase family)
MDTPGTVLGFLSTPLATHRLHGKVAIITGGAGKIGVEVAGRFLREAANVVLVDTDPFALDAAVEILKGALVTGEVVNGRIHCVLADAATVEGVKHYVQSCLKIFHRLDIAFLNVGIRHPAKSLFQTTEEEYDDIMRVNTKSGKCSRESPALSVPAFFNFSQRS